jgi:hypothetical protein
MGKFFKIINTNNALIEKSKTLLIYYQLQIMKYVLHIFSMQKIMFLIEFVS